MVLFYFTCASLDILAGVGWWITKSTVKGLYNGIHYLIYKNSIKKITREELLEEIKKLQKQIEYVK